MADDNTTQCWLFDDLAKRQVVVRFDQERGSSDGGAVLLGAADRRLGLSEALAKCLRDDRVPERVVHEILDLSPAAGVRDCLRVPGRQRRGSAVVGPGAQASLGLLAPGRGGSGVPADAEPLREQGGSGGAVPDGRGAGGAGDRAPSPSSPRTGASGDDRPGSDGRPGSRRAAAGSVQRVLRRMVLPAAARLRGLRRRRRSVPGGGDPAAGELPGQEGLAGGSLAAAAAATQGLPQGPL